MARNVHQYPYLARIHKEINSLFERFMETSPGVGLDLWEPPVDVFQRGDFLQVRVDLPGIDPKDVSISLRGNVLFIRGQKRPNRYPQAALICFHCMEISHGHFEKAVHLSMSVDTRNATAKLKDGVLTLTLPKAASARPRRIRVVAG